MYNNVRESPLPVGVFGFARPEHLERCLSSLAKCAEATRVDLQIFCDGPPPDANRDLLKRVAETRAVATEATGFGTVRLSFSDINHGVSVAVPAGVTSMLKRNEYTIIIEDDLEVSPFFLKYMQDALCIYSNAPQVMAISGYTWPTFEDERTDTYFTHFAHYWGWATWRRAWKAYSDDGTAIHAALAEKQLLQAFDEYSVWPRKSTEVLGLYNAGQMGIWDICWSASVLLNKGLCLYPRRTLIRNHGFDGSGMHCRKFPTVAFELQQLSSNEINVTPAPLVEDGESKERHRAMRHSLLKGLS